MPAQVTLASRVAAVEASAAGVHWTYAPMVDIARDPRWGRIAEGSGEDPYLGSLLAAARVAGFQGENLARGGTLLACPKHFAAYGGAEGGRDYNVVDISERTLREIYLPPFEAAVRAGAGSIMCSFNEIAGMPSSANRRLLTDILRGEWGFGGFVVSDWGSVAELCQHGIAADLKEAGRLALSAGVDMDMEGNAYSQHLADLVRSGRIAQSVLDQAVRRILRAKFALGLFDDPSRGSDPSAEHGLILTPSHRALAREVAQKSIVLLKNDGRVLPLRKDMRTLAVIGPLADDRESGHGELQRRARVSRGAGAQGGSGSLPCEGSHAPKRAIPVPHPVPAGRSGVTPPSTPTTPRPPSGRPCAPTSRSCKRLGSAVAVSVAPAPEATLAASGR